MIGVRLADGLDWWSNEGKVSDCCVGMVRVQLVALGVLG